MQEKIKGRAHGLPGWESGLIVGDNIRIRVEWCPWSEESLRGHFVVNNVKYRGKDALD